jgi:hypothetical protein
MLEKIMPSGHNQVRGRESGGWMDGGVECPRDRVPHHDGLSLRFWKQDTATSSRLLALRVVVALALASTALAACRPVPSNTTALAPDGRALEDASQRMVTHIVKERIGTLTLPPPPFPPVGAGVAVVVVGAGEPPPVFPPPVLPPSLIVRSAEPALK